MKMRFVMIRNVLDGQDSWVPLDQVARISKPTQNCDGRAMSVVHLKEGVSIQTSEYPEDLVSQIENMAR